MRTAWPTTAVPNLQEARLKEFGHDKYDKAGDKPSLMVALLQQADQAYATAGYAALLASAGWTPH